MLFVIHTPPPLGPGDYTLQGTTPYTSLAAFGQVSLNLSNGLQFQLGARYSFNKEVNEAQINQYGLPIADFQSTHSYNISYKASVNWTINDDQFVYAFVSTGFKPGGLNLPVIPGVLPTPFKAESVQSFETGWKATWLDGHLLSQVDAYYNKYDNFQVTIGFPLFPVFPFEVNDPHGAQIYGFEGETQASFGDFAFTAGAGLMHSGIGKFFATDPRIASFGACDPATGPSSPSCINLTGHPQTYAPDVTFNFSAQYMFHLDNGDTLTPRANFAHESGQWATLFDNSDLGDRLAARNLLGAQLEWKHEDYVFTLYATNLTDQHYEAALNSGLRFAGAPRQYGIRLMTAF
jgi:iron complex outermembrane receptor protein